jgi:hypothetical protein
MVLFRYDPDIPSLNRAKLPGAIVAWAAGPSFLLIFLRRALPLSLCLLERQRECHS